MTDSFDLEGMRKAVRAGRVEWRKHALEQLYKRKLSRAQVSRVLTLGEVIETYLHDAPFPSCLLLHRDPDPLHVVAAFDSESQLCYVITAYAPNLYHFESDFRTRRKSQ